MKTEVFLNMRPGLGGASKLNSLPKIQDEENVTILLLDTPQNTPVGTPGSDYFSDVLSDSPRIVETSGSSSEAPRSSSSDSLGGLNESFEVLSLSDTSRSSSNPMPSTSATGNVSDEDNCETGLAIGGAPTETELVIGEVRRTAPVNIHGARRKVNKRRKKTPLYYSDCFKDYYTMTDEVLGEGSCAEVRTCVHNRDNKECAVKIIYKNDFNPRTKVFNEVEMLSVCNGQENIVQMLDFFEEKDRFYLVFEKVYGGPLFSHIRRKVRFTENEASRIIKDIATALKYLHSRGVAHRDLKPENILCFSADQICPVKVCDLDLGSGLTYSSRSSSESASSRCSTPELHSPVGSAEYMAPEVVWGFTNEITVYDKRCDLWSLGVIMYVLLCGYPPFRGSCGTDCGWESGNACGVCQADLFNKITSGVHKYPEEKWADISAEAKDLIDHLLVKDPKARYTAEGVLNHPWIASGGCSASLNMPFVMERNSSDDDLPKSDEKALRGTLRRMVNLPTYRQRRQESVPSSSEEDPESKFSVFTLSPRSFT